MNKLAKIQEIQQIKKKKTRDFNRWLPEIILTPLTHDFLLPKGFFQGVAVFHLLVYQYLNALHQVDL